MNGIIVVNKEKKFTSFDVVAKLRGILKQKKMGHTGTLDPEATGVLPICLGNATKLCDMLTEKKKEYIAEFVLGMTTDTQDIWGQILSKKEISCTEEQLRETIRSFVGDIMQIPPMYSAVRVDGKRLYELARMGIEVERQARPVSVYEIEILELHIPKVKIRVLCSKGTYIRTLIHDIGQAVFCGATMTSLVRTKSGAFYLEDACTLEEIEKKRDQKELEDIIIPVDRVFVDLPAIVLDTSMEKRILNGNLINREELRKLSVYHGNLDSLMNLEEKNNMTDYPSALALCRKNQRVRIYYQHNHICQFMAIYQYNSEKNGIVPEKMFLPS